MTDASERVREVAAYVQASDFEYDMGAQYWRDHANRGGPLKPLGRPCHDCAVTTGFYEPLSADLARQPGDIVEKVCGNWFCHNHGDRACRGNIDLVHAVRRILEERP